MLIFLAISYMILLLLLLLSLRPCLHTYIFFYKQIFKKHQFEVAKASVQTHTHVLHDMSLLHGYNKLKPTQSLLALNLFFNK